jgi:iron(III) transport system permease protein
LLIGLRAGITVLSTEIYLQTRPPVALPNYGLAATYSVLLLALAVGPLLVSGRIIGRSERYATITGKGYQPRRYPLGAWKVPVLIAVGLFGLISVGLPVLSMFWVSLQPFFTVPSIEALGRASFDAYGEILALPIFRSAVVNTLILGVAAGAITMLLGLLVAWILVRSRSRLRPLLDVLAFMPHAFPGVILGLSILLIYLFLPIRLYGTIWIIVLALATQEISLATRLMSGAIAQVQRELEEAAETSGASWVSTMRRVLAPLVLPALLNGFFLIFISAIKNLTLALILFSQDSVVLSTVLFTNWDQGHVDRTGALGMIMMLITVLAGFVTRRLSLLGAARI